MWQDKHVAHLLDVKHRSDDVLVSESVSFEELFLSEEVLSGLKKSGFYTPSPIQLKAIPLGRCGLDLVVQAKSGTGKTCVFSVIALDSINVKSSSLQIVVLAPTREIALQIHGVISCIGRDLKGLSVQVFIGGTLVSDDRIKAKKCHIAIGSPGRLKQLIELGILNTRNVRMFVLDEADKLVEEGSFQKQINWIFSSLPKSKQTLALSATYPEELAQFLTRYMRQPTFVRLDPAHPSLLGLRQYYVVVKKCSLPHLLFEEKTNHVINLLSSVTFQQVLVFSNYHSRAESICEALNSNGWPSTFISGNMEQSRRTEAINNLKQFKCRVLISTDLTSRGIDANNVNMVINMDVPGEWDTYMHRIGRAGRYGSRGIAVSLVSAGEEEQKLLTLAAQCNATILPLNNIAEELGHHLSKDENQTIQTQMNNDVANDPLNSNIQLPLVEAPKQTNDTSSSPPSVRSESQSSSSSSSETSVQAPDDDFLNRVIRENADVPLIPSLVELQSKTEQLRGDRRYLKMSYADLKKDYEHFSATGEFLEYSSASVVDGLETQISKLNIDDNKPTIPSQTKSNDVSLNGYSKSEPASRNSSESLTPFNKNVESKVTPVHKSDKSLNLQNPIVQKVKPKSNYSQIKHARSRHPQSAAAGLEILKHWTKVEKITASSSNADKQKRPSINSNNSCADPHERVENQLNSFTPPEKPTLKVKNPPKKQRNKVTRSDPSSSSSSTNMSHSTSTKTDETSSSYSSSSNRNSSQFNIPAPPPLYPFGPTGHCFNPYMCSHSSLAAANEAMVSHQVYHHALNHARKFVYRL